LGEFVEPGRGCDGLSGNSGGVVPGNCGGIVPGCCDGGIPGCSGGVVPGNCGGCVGDVGDPDGCCGMGCCCARQIVEAKARAVKIEAKVFIILGFSLT
jgi:hypothetical protein